MRRLAAVSWRNRNAAAKKAYRKSWLSAAWHRQKINAKWRPAAAKWLIGVAKLAKWRNGAESRRLKACGIIIGEK